MKSTRLEYIWYCVRVSCGSIVLKSNELVLPKNKKYECKRCLAQYTGLELMRNNKRNIKKFADSLAKQTVDNSTCCQSNNNVVQ